MLSKKQALTVAAFTDIICITFSAWLYNFAIGAPILSFECILYTLVISFIVTCVSFIFVFKTEDFKKYFKKSFLFIFIAQFAMYKVVLLIMFFLV